MNINILCIFLGVHVILVLGKESLCSFNRECECFEAGKRIYVTCESITCLSHLQDIFSNNRFLKPVSVFTIKKCKSKTFLNIFSNVAIEEIRSSCPINEIESGALTSIQSLKVLNLQMAEFKKVPKAISKLSNLKVMSMVDGKLTGVDTELQDLSNLLKLQLARNDIRQISYEAFSWNSNIQFIDLSRNKLLFLYPGTFDNCKKLTKLSLRNNYLSSVDGLFTVRSLKEITVRDNNIKSIDNAFQYESDLEILNTGRNPLYEISDSAFSSRIRHLRTLILDYCELTFLTFTIFNSLTKLEKIDLSFNRLESLPVEIFRNLNNLVEVNLKANRLSHLGQVFIHSPRLENIILSKNHLQSCEEIFEDLRSLKKVDLRDNELKVVTKECFSSSSMLTTLQLSKNRIYRIDTEAFTSLKYLKNLFLNHNNLAYLNDSVGKIPELEVLYLDHNTLNEVRENDFQNLSKLKRLNLGYNRISTVTRLFRNLLNLESLTISKNKLTTLTKGSFPVDFPVKEIFLSGNKWVCDCRLMWILNFKASTHMASKIRCSEPQRFFGKILSQLTPLDLMIWNENCD